MKEYKIALGQNVSLKIKSGNNTMDVLMFKDEEPIFVDVEEYGDDLFHIKFTYHGLFIQYWCNSFYTERMEVK